MNVSHFYTNTLKLLFKRVQLKCPVCWHTIMILSFWTDRPRQTVQTQPQSDQGLHSLLQLPLHLLDTLL